MTKWCWKCCFLKLGGRQEVVTITKLECKSLDYGVCRTEDERDNTKEEWAEADDEPDRQVGKIKEKGLT